jgi:rhodanese-related sulfurtransferase
MRRFWIVVILPVLLLAACTGSANTPLPAAAEISGTQVKVDGGVYTNVTPSELQAMLTNKDFTMVNVHIPFEGDIAGTDVSIPYDQITQHLDQLPAKEAKILLYCRSGRMSDIAARELVASGYTNVWNLDGGMVAWEAAGLDVQR